MIVQRIGFKRKRNAKKSISRVCGNGYAHDLTQ